MKTIKLSTITALIAVLILSSCIQGNITPPYGYNLNIQVFDKDGKNRVDNLLLKDNNNTKGVTYEIIGNPYVTLSTSEPSFPGGADLKTVIKNGDYKSACLGTTIFTNGKGFNNKLIHKFADISLFGDMKEHVIESEWELQEGGETVCKSVRVDGKAYPVIEDKNDPSTVGYLVIIQLD